MNFIVKCNDCGFGLDVKYKSRFDKIKQLTFLCKKCIVKNKTRVCPKCNNEIIYQSPSSKKRADELNSICKKCCSNQIPQILTMWQQSFVDGLLLGDASIVYGCKNKSLYPRLTISRKEEDKDYLYWQYESFQDFYGTGPKSKRCFDKRFNKEYYQYHLQTKSGKIFSDLYTKWYHNGIKIVPTDLKLSPILLLIWFLDDGCIINSSKTRLTIKLSTHGFTKNDVLFLANLLCQYFNEKFHYYEDNGKWFIKAGTLPSLKFIKEIDSVFPDCMQRKRTWTNFDFDYVNSNINLYG